MRVGLKKQLIDIARREIPSVDISHDFLHAKRVMELATKIARLEKADLDIVIPAALFHDVVSYPKNSPRAHLSSKHSAARTAKILRSLTDYPIRKIPAVVHAIEVCSFSKNIGERSLEAWIVQDADSLEASGAIAIMRTFATAGQVKRPFYNEKNPFSFKCEADGPSFGIDLFFKRLLLIPERLKTKSAKVLVKRRHKFLLKFLQELDLELKSE